MNEDQRKWLKKKDRQILGVLIVIVCVLFVFFVMSVPSIHLVLDNLPKLAGYYVRK